MHHDDSDGTRPRVVHVTTAHPADDVRIFERECRSLVGTGRYDVVLAAAGTIPAGSGVTLIPLTPVPSGRLARFSAGPRKAFALARVIAADVWHFHDPELLPVAYRLARSGRKVIWDAHEDYQSQFTSEGGKNWIPGPMRGLVRAGTQGLLAAVDRHAAGVVAATSTIATRYSNPRTVIVGNETRLEAFEGCRPSFSAKRLLFTGTVGTSHLFDEVVEAVAQVPDARLAVAGREPDPVLWASAEQRLGDRLAYLGWLGRAELAEAMNDSSLGFLTYADTAAYAVASPTKSYEFAAAGLPMIASPNPMNLRALGDSGAGFIATDFSAPALSEAVRRGLGDLVTWEGASRAARAWAAQNGSWAPSEARLLNLYSELLPTSQ